MSKNRTRPHRSATAPAPSGAVGVGAPLMASSSTPAKPECLASLDRAAPALSRNNCATTPHIDGRGQARHHAKTDRARRDLLATLYGGWLAELPHADRLLKLHDRIAACCSGSRVMQDNATGRLVRVAMACDSRLCPRCAITRSVQTKLAVTEIIGRMDSPRLLTLTLAATDSPLSVQIDRLRACFREFRRHQSWKRHVRGGVALLECTYRPKTDQWHPHLHLVVDAIYWRQQAISAEWLAVTGDSSIVDIRMVNSKAAAAAYVAKYVSKCPKHSETPAERRCEWAAAMHGQRIMQTWGSLHGSRTRPAKTPRPEGLREVVIEAAMLEAIQAGDAVAWDLWTRLERLPFRSDDEQVTAMHRAWADEAAAWQAARIADVWTRGGAPPRKVKPPPRPKPPPGPKLPGFDQIKTT